MRTVDNAAIRRHAAVRFRSGFRSDGGHLSRVMEAMAESVRNDLIGDDAPMPRVSKTEDTFRASDCLEQGCISHGCSWPN